MTGFCFQTELKRCSGGSCRVNSVGGRGETAKVVAAANPFLFLVRRLYKLKRTEMGMMGKGGAEGRSIDIPERI